MKPAHRDRRSRKWGIFGDPQLNELKKRYQSNQDLKVAEVRSQARRYSFNRRRISNLFTSRGIAMNGSQRISLLSAGAANNGRGFHLTFDLSYELLVGKAPT